CPCLLSSAEVIPPAQPVPTTTTSTLSNFSAIMYLLINYIIADSLLNSLVQAFETLLNQLNQHNSHVSLDVLSSSSLSYLDYHHIMDQHKHLQLSFFLTHLRMYYSALLLYISFHLLNLEYFHLFDHFQDHKTLYHDDFDFLNLPYVILQEIQHLVSLMFDMNLHLLNLF